MTQRTSFAKLQRDRDKQAKAAAKRDRRQERAAEPETSEALPLLLDDSGAELTASQLLDLVEAVHRQYAEETIDFETFEQTKAALLSRLPVD
ncbi:MAG: hypothetical protein M3N98_11315 [Actinomycetota bacterium]|nr:hypothetical protein [Actinomycetota bacterium]